MSILPGIPTKPAKAIGPQEVIRVAPEVAGLGAPQAYHYGEMAWTGLGGQGAISAGHNVLGQQNMPINRPALEAGQSGDSWYWKQVCTGLGEAGGSAASGLCGYAWLVPGSIESWG